METKSGSRLNVKNDVICALPCIEPRIAYLYFVTGPQPSDDIFGGSKMIVR